jgi:DNA polymerase alpha/epsilon subunit B
VWPIPPLSPKTTSNPCRIRIPQELVIWNAPMRQLWNEQALRIGDQANWITTPLDQGTLAPPASTPVHWNYASAMSLYPIPDALVVVGTDQAMLNHEDCQILQLPQHDSDEYAVLEEKGWRMIRLK